MEVLTHIQKVQDLEMENEHHGTLLAILPVSSDSVKHLTLFPTLRHCRENIFFVPFFFCLDSAMTIRRIYEGAPSLHRLFKIIC